MTAQHTPGPWRLSDFEVHPTMWKGAENTRSLALIARISSWGGDANELREQAAANAQLIAAAPELLAGAQVVLAWWNEWAARQPLDDSIEDAEWREFQVLRAAIAKATGEKT